MQFDKFVHSLPIALVMQAPQLPAKVAVAANSHVTDERQVSVRRSKAAIIEQTEAVIALADQTISHTIDEGSNTFTVQTPRLTESWLELKERYDAFVIKEAVGTISEAELVELEKLQKARRRFENPASGDEILQRHRREKLDQELLQVLQKYVRLQSFTSD